MEFTIGYVDENPHQVRIYRRKLKDFGFNVIGYEFKRNMSLDELMTQVYDSDIDLLMIDFKLNESGMVTFDGDKVESEIYDKKPNFPHIIFTNRVGDAEPHVEDNKIIFSKDLVFNTPDNQEVFATMLRKCIVQYRSHKERKKERLAHLISKSQSKNMSAADREEMLSLELSLKALDQSKPKEVPLQLTDRSAINDLKTFRQKAKELLKRIDEKVDEDKN